MRLAVVGTGYVGLVSGTCFAESGNDVIGIDNNPKKIEILDSGKLPIYEPGLLEMVQRNRKEGRLTFTDLANAIKNVEVVYLCVGTPQGDDGSADLSALWAVGDAIADRLDGYKLLVIKSTVPVGTNKKLTDRIAARTKQPFEVASNPEFLKEGAAIDDFMKPDRVVVGVRSERAQKLLHELYAPFLRTERPFLVMPPESAEMTKYVANAMLATKISFINEMSGLCDKMGPADINDVRRGIGHDVRIGFQFLFPGPGYGGSCFPKDVNALIAMAREKGVPSRLIEAVDLVNDLQKQVLPTKIKRHFGDKLKGKTIAVWGLAFKPRTDDIRVSPSLTLIDEMLKAGANLRVHDPEAMANVKEEYGNKLTYCDRRYDALEGADALVIVTEWQEFRTPDFHLVKEMLKSPVIFDGRNIYDPAVMKQHGFTYYGIGRQG